MSQMSSFFIGVLVVELCLSAADSLKDRRQVIRSLLDQAHRRWNVSVADLGPDGSWKRAVLAFSVVNSSLKHIDSLLMSVERFLEKAEDNADFEIVRRERVIKPHDEFSY